MTDWPFLHAHIATTPARGARRGLGKEKYNKGRRKTPRSEFLLGSGATFKLSDLFFHDFLQQAEEGVGASSHMTKCCALLLAQPGCHVKEGKNGQKATLSWPTPTYFLNPLQDGTGQHKAALRAKLVI